MRPIPRRTRDRPRARTEGLDFIETEEDVKAVEAATLKIQSTFRGKKIRSKFGAANKTEEPTQGPEVAPAAAAAPAKQVNKIAGQQQQQQTSCKTSTSKHKQPQQADETNELRERVGAMQVQDNGAEQPQVSAPHSGLMFDS